MAFFDCLKGLFYLINGVLVLCGLTGLAVGIWLFVDADHFTQIAGVQALNVENIKICGQVLMACGAGVVVFALVGVGGAKYNNVCLLAFYLLLLVIGMGVELTAVVIGVLLRKQVESELTLMLSKHVQNNYTGPRGQDHFTNAFNAFMTEMKCCGLTNGTTDFIFDTQAWNRTQADSSVHVVPSQCCKPSYSCESRPDDDNSYTQGCLDTIRDILYKYHTVIIVVAGTAFSKQFLLVVLAICLIGHRRRK